AVTDHAAPLAHRVRGHGHQAHGHLREVDVGVADGAGDGKRPLADLHDAWHVWSPLILVGSRAADKAIEFSMPARPRSAVIALAVVAAAAGAAQEDALPSARVAAVRAYIKSAWTTLTRSTRDLAKAAPDPKMPHTAGRPWPVYLPADEDRARVEAELEA